MPWAFWRRAAKSELKTQTRHDADQPPPEMDLSEMMAAPPPETVGQPDWMDMDALDNSVTPAPRPYLDVDLGRLQRQRLDKEAEGRFVARLKRGDVGLNDVPLTGAMGSLGSRIVEFLFRPIEGFFTNLGLVGAAVLLIGLAAVASLLYKQLFEWFFASVIS